MSMIAWNCQGFRAALTVNNLKEEVRKINPQLVFIMETKQKTSYMEKKKRAMGFEEAWYVPPEGKSGGLALWSTPRLHAPNQISLTMSHSSTGLLSSTRDWQYGII